MIVGRSQSAAPTGNKVSVVLFVALVSLVVFTILDLQQPRRGLVRIPQTAMQSLRASLGEPR